MVLEVAREVAEEEEKGEEAVDVGWVEEAKAEA
jgi:hypothetical protein